MAIHDRDDASRSSAADKYTVVARRYRPQSFDALVGQDQVAQGLANAIRQGRVGHAYLFAGARGIGKTSTARIFAKALNCSQGPTPEPCNECDNCLGITEGSDVDVLEMDAASNRGIDDIRDLRGKVSIRPSRSRYKIYIIDEVHMLTNEAFNALLKTLEEPPEHVVFLFCTTEPDKLPITIRSRCQRFDFPPLELATIIARLKSIASSEGLEADDRALRLIARRANGSMRDGESLLEQLLTFSSTTITPEDVHQVLGTLGSDLLGQLAGQVVAHDSAGALASLDAAFEAGLAARPLLEQLLGYFRDVMTALVGCQAEMMRHTELDQFELVSQHGELLGLETTMALLEVVTESLRRMQQNPHARTIAEMTVVRICALDKLDSLHDWLRSDAPPAAAPATTSPPTTPVPRTQPAAEKKTEPPQPATPNKPAAARVLDEASLQGIWQQVLVQAEDMTGDFLRAAETVAISAPNLLVVRFPASYTHAKESCERPERREKIEKLLAEITGTRVKVQCELLPASEAESSPRIVKSQRENMRDAEQVPLVREAMDVFDAEMTRIETKAAVDD